MNVIVRSAGAADYDAVLALEKQVFGLHYEHRPDCFRWRDTPLERERFDAMLADGVHILLVAAADGRVVGQALAFERAYRDHPVFKDRRWLEIDDLCVAAEARGRGIGTALFAELKRRALSRGLDHLELTVWAFNEDARRLYERLGMRSRIDRMEMEL
jgi:ribosomal protein S18 acetylase RimI-like enzyme